MAKTGRSENELAGGNHLALTTSAGWQQLVTQPPLHLAQAHADHPLDAHSRRRHPPEQLGRAREDPDPVAPREGLSQLDGMGVEPDLATLQHLGADRLDLRGAQPGEGLGGHVTRTTPVACRQRLVGGPGVRRPEKGGGLGREPVQQPPQGGLADVANEQGVVEVEDRISRRQRIQLVEQGFHGEDSIRIRSERGDLQIFTRISGMTHCPDFVRIPPSQSFERFP